MAAQRSSQMADERDTAQRAGQQWHFLNTIESGADLEISDPVKKLINANISRMDRASLVPLVIETWRKRRRPGAEVVEERSRAPLLSFNHRLLIRSIAGAPRLAAVLGIRRRDRSAATWLPEQTSISTPCLGPLADVD